MHGVYVVLSLFYGDKEQIVSDKASTNYYNEVIKNLFYIYIETDNFYS